MTYRTLQNFLFCILISAITSCSNSNDNNATLEFNSEFDQVLVNYKQLFETESISIIPFSADKSDTCNCVHAVIIEPKNLPQDDAAIDSLTLKFAQDVYNTLTTKEDFTDFKVEIAFKEDNFCDNYRRIKSSYSFETLADNSEAF